MGCKYSRFNEEGRFICTITDDECIYLLPNQNKCVKDGYLDEGDEDEI